MPLIVTPGRLAKLGEFYHQLGSMLAAGVTLTQTLEHIHQAPPALFVRRPVQRILADLAQGMTFSEALKRVPGWLPTFDIALLSAGEQGGRLDAACKLLAEYYKSRAQLYRQFMGHLAYPLFVLNAAVFLIPFAHAFTTGNWSAYFEQTLGLLGVLYLAVFLLAYACQGRRGKFWRSGIERVLHPVPILGGARRRLALARLCAALEALINAGVPMTEAWPLAAAASGSPALGRTVRRWDSRMRAGDSPGDLLIESRGFPDMFVNMYRNGEVSGTLDDSLRRLQNYYQDEAARKMLALAVWTPRLIYFGIVLALAAYVVRFYLGYFQQYNQLLNSP